MLPRIFFVPFLNKEKMRFYKNNIIFKTRQEALDSIDYLRDQGITLYTCDRCGISFGSDTPDLIEGCGIVCALCLEDCL